MFFKQTILPKTLCLIILLSVFAKKSCVLFKYAYFNATMQAINIFGRIVKQAIFRVVFGDKMSDLDRSDMKTLIHDFPKHCENSWNLAQKTGLKAKIDEIIISGMGGSAIGGDIIGSYIKNIPVIVNRGYEIPSFISQNTLFFAVSFSGNTEETISALNHAYDKKAQIIVISSGGKIKQIAIEKELPFIEIPNIGQPRVALAYLFFPILRVLHNMKIVDAEKDVAAAISSLIEEQNQISNQMKDMAKRLKAKVPLIYASDNLCAVAYRWKTQINENAKQHAFYHLLPEMNHNEIVAYENKNNIFKSIFIVDDDDHERIKKRVEIFADVVKGADVEIIKLHGSCFLARMIKGIHMGDWLSYYLALENNVDPTPVKIIELLKKELKLSVEKNQIFK